MPCSVAVEESSVRTYELRSSACSAHSNRKTDDSSSRESNMENWRSMSCQQEHDKSEYTIERRAYCCSIQWNISASWDGHRDGALLCSAVLYARCLYVSKCRTVYDNIQDTTTTTTTTVLMLSLNCSHGTTNKAEMKNEMKKNKKKRRKEGWGWGEKHASHEMKCMKTCSVSRDRDRKSSINYYFWSALLQSFILFLCAAAAAAG